MNAPNRFTIQSMSRPYAHNVDRTHDLQIFSLTLSQLSYMGRPPSYIYIFFYF